MEHLIAMVFHETTEAWAGRFRDFDNPFLFPEARRQADGADDAIFAAFHAHRDGIVARRRA